MASLLRSLPKVPSLPESARRFGIQAGSLAKEKQYDEAIRLYDQALEVAPWWAEGHCNRALITASQHRYRDAIASLKLYLIIAPNAPDARAAQDQIYE